MEQPLLPVKKRQFLTAKTSNKKASAHARGTTHISTLQRARARGQCNIQVTRKNCGMKNRRYLSELAVALALARKFMPRTCSDSCEGAEKLLLIYPATAAESWRARARTFLFFAREREPAFSELASDFTLSHAA